MTKTIVMLSGYARSGKSTALEVAKGCGWKTLSTSRTLHTFTQKFFQSVFGIDIDTNNKVIQHFFYLLHTGVKTHDVAVSLSSRDLLIKVAEDCLRAVFGKDIFSRQSAKEINESNDSLFIIEMINTEEADYFVSALSKKEVSFKTLTIKRQEAEKGVDSRNHIEGYFAFSHDYVIDNNGTKDEYVSQLKETLNQASQVSN